MRKLILLTSSLLSVIYLYAQPALTWERPPYGTQKTYYVYQGTMTDPAVGVNQTWDYSALTPTSYGMGVYTDPSTLPASAKDKFPTATYVEVWTIPAAPSLDKAIINYYYDCPDSLVSLGQQSSGGNNFSTWNEVQAVWNLAFGNSANARSRYTGKLATTSFKYAAYGTLKTKYGTYNNVVMISTPGTKTFFQTTPYVGVLMNILYANPTTIWGAHIYSYDGATGIDQLSGSEMKVYPNPTSGQLTIDFSNQQTASVLNLFNENGQSVLQKQVDGSIIHLDLENNPKGIYILKITSSATTAFRKIVLN